MRISGLILASLLSACEISINAIDIKKTGASQNASGGGCVDPSASGTVTNDDLALIDVTVNGKDYTEKFKDVPGGACIESVEDLSFDSRVDLLEAGTNCGDGGDSLRGTLNVVSLHLDADKGPAALQIACPASAVPVADATALKDAADACGNAQKETVKEWLRQAINARADKIGFKATAGCSDNACFSLGYTVAVRISKPTINVLKGCTEKHPPLN